MSKSLKIRDHGKMSREPMNPPPGLRPKKEENKNSTTKGKPARRGRRRRKDEKEPWRKGIKSRR